MCPIRIRPNAGKYEKVLFIPKKTIYIPNYFALQNRHTSLQSDFPNSDMLEEITVF